MSKINLKDVKEVHYVVDKDQNILGVFHDEKQADNSLLNTTLTEALTELKVPLEEFNKVFTRLKTEIRIVKKSIAEPKEQKSS